MLPLPCKVLALAYIREQKVSPFRISEAFKRFRHVCFSFTCQHNDFDVRTSSSNEDTSSTTAYPTSISSQGSLEINVA